MIINYHMTVLGQLEGLSGHLSPLGGYCRSQDRVLLMDVWWETRPCWVQLQDLWVAMDTVDPASKEKVGLDGLGCTLVATLQSVIFREGLFWLVPRSNQMIEDQPSRNNHIILLLINQPSQADVS